MRFIPLSVAPALLVVTLCAESVSAQAAGNPPVVKQPVVKEQGFVPFSDAPIHYRSERLDDPIARL